METANLALRRKGLPSPILFHLTAAIQNIQGQSKSDNPLVELDAAVSELTLMLTGIKHWQEYPWQRPEIAPPAIWQKGSTTLIDYGDSSQLGDSFAPVLIVPSLVNKSYILDLTLENSFIRGLQQQGLRPFLLDWGSPTFSESSFTIADYIEKRALPALSKIAEITNNPVALVGYCMGGTIAAAMAQIGNNINALCTIGAPWSFANASVNRLVLQNLAKKSPEGQIAGFIDQLGHIFGALPHEVLQYLFAAIKPEQAFEKFKHFVRHQQNDEVVRNFVAAEDWLNDGVALAGPAAKELLLGWHVNDDIMQGRWLVNQSTIDARQIQVPSLFVCGQKDNIAPLNTTLALPNLVPNSKIALPNTGHVGMIIGKKARNEVVTPVANFLKAQAKLP